MLYNGWQGGKARGQKARDWKRRRRHGVAPYFTLTRRDRTLFHVVPSFEFPQFPFSRITNSELHMSVRICAQYTREQVSARPQRDAKRRDSSESERDRGKYHLYFSLTQKLKEKLRIPIVSQICVTRTYPTAFCIQVRLSLRGLRDFLKGSEKIYRVQRRAHTIRIPYLTVLSRGIAEFLPRANARESTLSVTCDSS